MTNVRDYVGDEPMYRAVCQHKDDAPRYFGPYRTAAPAKATVTQFTNKGKSDVWTGYVETAYPVWVRVE